MTINDISKLKRKIKLGTIIKLPKEYVRLTHGNEEPLFVEVVGLYNHFFNVKHDEGYQQSIQYKDLANNGIVIIG